MKMRIEPENRSWPRESTKNPKKDPLILLTLLRSSLWALCVLLWQSALADVHYVDVKSTNATSPYINWSTAATNIQDAVDAAIAGDEIVVTNRIYASVRVNKAVSVRSVNGPRFTFINGGGSSLCVYLTNGASLSGFRLTNGFGGVWCASPNVIVSNCVIAGNGGSADGGGAYGGTLNNCTLVGNWASVGVYGSGSPGYSWHAQGGGASSCILNNCTLIGNSASVGGYTDYFSTVYARGGGAYSCTLNHCTLKGNSAYTQFYGLSTATYEQGGGACACTLNDCTLTSNSVASAVDSSGIAGGGAYECTLNNCVLTGNWIGQVPANGYGMGGGGAAYCALNNCTLTGNSASNSAGGSFGGTLNNCISFRNPPDGDAGSPGRLAGTSWIGDPLFFNLASGNLRLQANSPCINAGDNSYVTNATDMDGAPRIAGGSVDLGAYEFQSPASMISYAWLQQYRLLPASNSTDTADPDGDGVNNYREWLADCDPTNAVSFPRLRTFTVLHTFAGSSNDGSHPYAGLILSGSTLYGTAYDGGSANNGTVFAIKTDGTGYTNLHSFSPVTYDNYFEHSVNSDGAHPYAGLVLSSNTLYGTASDGGGTGAGTVFALNTDGTGFRTVYTFTALSTYYAVNSDGASPRAGLILSSNTLYGTAYSGGSSAHGTIFAINSDGTGFRNLHNFSGGSDGLYPYAGLVLSGSSLYGTSSSLSGTIPYGNGTVFALSTEGTGFTNLHTFAGYPSDGANPYAGLILAGNRLY